jgi:hypothetical protein
MSKLEIGKKKGGGARQQKKIKTRKKTYTFSIILTLILTPPKTSNFNTLILSTF